MSEKILKFKPVISFEHLCRVDPEVYRITELEMQRQVEKIRLIPSENYMSSAVLNALSTVFSNKYAEGYPGKRYYEGNEYSDMLEELACQRAKQLFKADHANVQSYSGSPANMAAYFALLKPGDKIMGMHLPTGGHLTHGWKVSFSGMLYQSVPYGYDPQNGVYGVDPDTGLLDFDQIRKIALKEKPKVIVSGATAYPRQIDFKPFYEIAQEIGAYHIADISHINGLIVSGVHNDPVPYSDVITSTSHKSIRGPRGAFILCKDRVIIKDGKEHRLPDLIDRAVFPTLQGGPHLATIAAIAVCFKEAMSEEFKEYGKQVVKNAKALAEALIERGFHLVTGGTDNHLILVNVMKSRGIPGKPLAKALDRAGIVCNFNSVPNDPRKAFDPSGIRLGTPAITTRGFKEEEMKLIAEWIDRVARNIDNEEVIKKVREETKELCTSGRFPVPGIQI